MTGDSGRRGRARVVGMQSEMELAAAPLLAASIFLDVLNVFLFFLQIFSSEER